jgi:hypothetical protein
MIILNLLVTDWQLEAANRSQASSRSFQEPPLIDQELQSSCALFGTRHKINLVAQVTQARRRQVCILWVSNLAGPRAAGGDCLTKMAIGSERLGLLLQILDHSWERCSRSPSW